ncbi:MAG: AAA family ATPase [Spirochaetaceae bacterium]|jgi:AAA+ superfamily predicted ATPase/S1-C subfamily serine protease|nr:AAA family ATPase [Spirochaetaceae bacterium]
MSKFKRYDEHGFVYVFGKEGLFCDDTLKEQNLEQHIVQALLDDKIYELILFYDRKGGIRYAKPEMRQLYYEMTGHNVPQKTAAKHKTLPIPRRGVLSSGTEPEPRPETQSTAVEPESELVSSRDALKIFEAVLERKHRIEVSAAIVIMDMANWLDNELQDLNFFLDTYKNHAGNDLIVFCFKGFTPQEAYRKYEHSPVAGYLTEWRNYLDEKKDAGKFPNIIFIEPPSRAEVRNLLHKKHILGELAIPPSQLDAVSEEVFRAAREEDLTLAGVRVRIDTNCKGKTPPVLFDQDACAAIFGVKKPSKTSKELLNEMAGLSAVHDTLESVATAVYNENLDKQMPVYRSRFAEARNDEDEKRKNLTLHFALKGSPGTGKTTVAMLLGQYLHEIGALSSGHVIKCVANDLIGNVVGDTAIKTDKKVQEALGGVLLIDEISGIVGDTKDESRQHTNSFAKDLNSVLLNAMTMYPDLSVVIAGYERDVDAFIASDDGFTRRFTYPIKLPDYNGAELADIFRRMSRKDGYTIDSNLDDILVDFMNNWLRQKRNDGSWGNAGFVEILIKRIKGGRKRSKGDRVIKAEDIPDAITIGKVGYDLKKCLVTGENAPSPTERLDALIGLQGVKNKINLLAKNIKVKKRQGRETKPPLNFVFTGNPGTGKTTVAGIFGEILVNIGVLSFSETVTPERAELIGSHEGDTERKLKEVFEGARHRVLVIDEAYQYIGEGRVDYGKKVIQYLVDFTGKKENKGEICIILAGYPNEMKAFISQNPGLRRRFPTENWIEFDDYSDDELFLIFERLCKREKYTFTAEFGELLKRCIPAIRKSAKVFGNAGEMDNLFNLCDQIFTSRVCDLENIVNEFTADDLRGAMKAKGLAIPDEQETVGSREVTLPSKAQLAKTSATETGYDARHAQEALIRIHTDSGVGSGFLITEDGYAVTCEHVVRNAGTIKARVRVRDSHGNNVDTEHPCVVAAANNAADIAIIKLDAGTRSLPCAGLFPDKGKDLEPGNTVKLWSYPFGDRYDEPTLYSGAIASYQKINGGEKILLNIEGKSGSSGGMCIDPESGSVIGVFCGSDVESREGLTEEINYARPVRYVWDMLPEKNKKSKE